MSTPYTLMRCRMKHLISCFNACKVPIDEDEDDLDPQEPKASSIGDDRQRGRNEKLKIGTTSEKVGGEDSPASWQSCESEEDDYIVFQFKDGDAGGEVIEERRSVESSLERRHNVADGNRRKVDAKSFNSENEEVNESDELRDPLGDSSDSSTSSFAFPRIQNEWTGSSVLMPRPEESWNWQSSQ